MTKCLIVHQIALLGLIINRFIVHLDLIQEMKIKRQLDDEYVIKIDIDGGGGFFKAKNIIQITFNK